MNPQVLLSGLLGLIVFVAAGLAQPALEEQIRDRKLGDAALRAVEESLDFLKERLSTPKQLADVMRSNPAEYQSTEQSKRLLQARERTALKDGVRKQLTRFADRRTDLSPGWVDKLMSNQEERIARTINALLGSDFDMTYTQARESAVQAQRTELTAVLYPEPAEIEQLAGPEPVFLAKRLDEVRRMVQRGHLLVKVYVTRVVAGRTPFEENQADLEERIAAGANDGLVQLWRQLQQVRQHNGGGAIELSSLKTMILAAVEQVAKQAVVKSYGVFSSVHAAIDKRAWALEIDLFMQFVREDLNPRGGCPALPKERVLRDVPQSFEDVPAEWTAHVQALGTALRSETERLIADRYAARLQDPSLREQFRDKLYRLLTQDDQIRAAFWINFHQCLERPLKEHRAKLALHELASRWPSVADLSYEFGDPTLTHLYSGSETPASEFPGTGEGTAEWRLEETQQTFREHKEKLVDEARAAIRRQVALVTEQKRQRRYVERIGKDEDRSDARRVYWQQAYEEEVRQEWQKVRAEVLLKGENRQMLHPNKYNRVFQLTSETTANIITTEWAKPVQKPEEVAQPTTPKTRQLVAGGPSGRGECGNEKAYDSCRKASQACYEASVHCSEARASCSDALAHCRAAKKVCDGGG